MASTFSGIPKYIRAITEAPPPGTLTEVRLTLSDHIVLVALRSLRAPKAGEMVRVKLVPAGGYSVKIVKTYSHAASKEADPMRASHTTHVWGTIQRLGRTIAEGCAEAREDHKELSDDRVACLRDLIEFDLGIQEQEAQLAEVQEELARAATDIAKFGRDLAAIAQGIEAANPVVEGTREETEAKTGEITALTHELDTKRKTLTGLVEKEAQVESKREKITQLRSGIETYQKNSQQRLAKLATTRDGLVTKQAELEAARAQLQIAEQVREAVYAKHQEPYLRIIGEVDGETNDAMEEAIRAKANDHFVPMQAARTSFSVAHEKVKTLEGEIAQLEADCQELQGKEQEKKAKAERRLGEVQALEEEIKTDLATVALARTEIAKLEEQQAVLEREAETLAATHTVQVAVVARLRASQEEPRAAMARLEERQTELLKVLQLTTERLTSLQEAKRAKFQTVQDECIAQLVKEVETVHGWITHHNLLQKWRYDTVSVGQYVGRDFYPAERDPLLAASRSVLEYGLECITRFGKTIPKEAYSNLHRLSEFDPSLSGSWKDMVFAQGLALRARALPADAFGD